MPLVDVPPGAQYDAPSGLSDLPTGAALDQQSWLAPLTQAAGGMVQSLNAAAQGTSPVLSKYGAPLGEVFQTDSGPAYKDPSGNWQFIDPNSHVVLNDQTTGKALAFARTDRTNEGLLPSLGRILGFGAMAPSSIPSAGLAAPAAQAIATRFAGPDAQALGRVGDALRADVAAGGPGPQQIVDSLLASRYPAAPMNIADVAGENVRGLAGQVARMPGPGRQQIMQALNDRDAQAGTRLAQATNDMAASGPGNFLAAQQLEQQAKAAAAPLYSKAYMVPPLYSERLAQFTADPIIKQGLAQGLEIQRLENLASGKPPLPGGYNVTWDQGIPDFAPVSKTAPAQAAPSGTFAPGGALDPNQLGLGELRGWNMQTLDAAKRGLDNMLEGYRDSTTGKLALDQRGHAIDQVRRSFLNELDQLNPDYGAARAAFAGPQQARGALLQGSQIFNKDPDQIASEVAGLSPGNQPFYRLGAANALKTALAKTSSGGDEARQLIGNAYKQKQLTAVFPNADQLLGAAKQESQMFGTRQALLGNSATAARLAQDQGGGEGGGILRPLAEMGTALATHEPMLAAKSGLSALQSLFRNGGMTPEVGSKIAGYLLQGDPAAARAWLMDAFDRGAPQVGRVRPMTPFIDYGAQQYPTLPPQNNR